MHQSKTAAGIAMAALFCMIKAAGSQRIPPGTCQNGQCNCGQDYHDLESTMCIPGDTGTLTMERCSSNEDCARLKGSLACAYDTTIHTAVCACHANYMPSAVMDECRKVDELSRVTCNDDSDCQPSKGLQHCVVKPQGDVVLPPSERSKTCRVYFPQPTMRTYKTPQVTSQPQKTAMVTSDTNMKTFFTPRIQTQPARRLPRLSRSRRGGGRDEKNNATEGTIGNVEKIESMSVTTDAPLDSVAATFVGIGMAVVALMVSVMVVGFWGWCHCGRRGKKGKEVERHALNAIPEVKVTEPSSSQIVDFNTSGTTAPYASETTASTTSETIESNAQETIIALDNP
ncbi:hypothetical protein V1264_010298 [Littorina saxatilis]|uniref:Uncharacterized protein n=1 Tax=Littorina saxatilis TaxID=31220 RepID=A0AAN9G038_9CAEN